MHSEVTFEQLQKDFSSLSDNRGEVLLSLNCVTIEIVEHCRAVSGSVEPVHGKKVILRSPFFFIKVMKME